MIARIDYVSEGRSRRTARRTISQLWRWLAAPAFLAASLGFYYVNTRVDTSEPNWVPLQFYDSTTGTWYVLVARPKQSADPARSASTDSDSKLPLPGVTEGKSNGN